MKGEVEMDDFSTLKVIKASAGTGKTYRLSLEFIRLILKYGDYINFDEILIITFTRKATAEIRERIFEHLEVLTNNRDGYAGLVNNLRKLDDDLSFSAENLSQLKNIYHQMITDKGNLRISTIDSFVFSIFTSIIAPHYNIESPVIDDTINKDYLPELFEALFASQNLDRFNRIFTRAYARNLKSYEKFILDLIRNRWQIELGAKDKEASKKEERSAAEHLEKYIQKMAEAFRIFAQYLEADDKSFEPAVIFNQKFKELMDIDKHAASLSQANFEKFFLQTLQDRQFIDENFSDLLSLGSFFNGSKLMRKKDFSGYKDQIYELQQKAEDDLSNYLLNSHFKQEQNEILEIAEVIYKAYDRVKFRDCIFTYDDISYYTYRFLYDPEISIFESTSVLNVFYEFLSFNIRFLLIDEFQDTSVIQWSILQPIISDIISGEGIKPYGGAIIVGDEKQSIYGWRGGERELLLKAGNLLNRIEEPDSLKRCFRYSEFLSKRINRLFRSDHLHGFLAKAGIFWDYAEIEADDKSDKGYFDYSLTNLSSANCDKREYFEQVIVKDLLPLLKNDEIEPAATAILTRRNKDLALIAEILSAHNIPFLMESSNSVFQHQAIAPILHLLRYLVIDDIYDLLKFLRSDAVLFSAKELKHIIEKYQANENRKQFLKSLSEDPVFSSIREIHKDLSRLNLTALIRKIIEQFSLNKTYSSELELRNISFFLEISASYFMNKIDVSASVEGFLDFIENNLDNSEYNQIGIDQSEVIRLMSIHKSKGLQFETLFFLFEANPQSVKNRNDLKIMFNYDDNYRSISPLYMTFNYGAVLKKGICAELHKKEVNKRIIEELNSLYVALTRVKSNLIIRGFYNLKRGIKDLLGNIQIDKATSINRIFTACFAPAFADELEVNGDGFSLTSGKIVKKTAENADQQNMESLAYPEKLFDLRYAKPENREKLDPIKIEHKLNEHRSKQKGIIIHEFLSHIRFSQPEELKLAEKKIIMKYGTMFPREVIRSYITEAIGFIERDESYFDPQQWDEVYNEFVIFDNYGNEKRIDRMLLDHTKKIVLILDYKTGTYQQTEEEQLREYKKIISELDIIRKEKYEIDYKFLENIEQEKI